MLFIEQTCDVYKWLDLFTTPKLRELVIINNKIFIYKVSDIVFVCYYSLIDTW